MELRPGPAASLGAVRWSWGRGRGLGLVLASRACAAGVRLSPGGTGAQGRRAAVPRAGPRAGSAGAELWRPPPAPGGGAGPGPRNKGRRRRGLGGQRLCPEPGLAPARPGQQGLLPSSRSEAGPRGGSREQPRAPGGSPNRRGWGSASSPRRRDGRPVAPRPETGRGSPAVSHHNTGPGLCCSAVSGAL